MQPEASLADMHASIDHPDWIGNLMNRTGMHGNSTESIIRDLEKFPSSTRAVH
jgi:hypothetical protein